MMMLPNVQTDPSTGAPALDARPKAETQSIEDLLEEARRGRIRIPRFQRALKWEPDDTSLLFDSIYRGYPIGTLLFWQTAAEAQRVHFGPVAIDAPARADAWWVVDGQQRLTSLVRVLLGDGYDAHALAFDLDREAFVRAGQAKKDAARYLPLTEVLDSERLHRWVADRELARERQTVAFRLNKRVREYSVPAYVVVTADENVLRRIFDRSNNTGKRLTQSDVFDALHGARSAEEPADFEGVAQSLEDLQFGTVEETILYRSLLAIHGYDAVGGELPASFQAVGAYPRTARAVRAAIVFVVNRVGIPHVDLLPYKQPLVALAKFFNRHPEPSARSVELLARWVWRGAWSERHRGDTVSTRATLGAIGDDENASVQALLATIPKEEPASGSSLPPYNFRHARSKLEILALLSLGPRELRTGAPLGGAVVAKPESVLSVVSTDHPLAKTAAARIVHPHIPRLRFALTHADADVRRTHAVSPDAYQALVADDEPRFLEQRAAEIKQLVHSFLGARAKWSDNDRPPLDALRVPDED